MEKSCTICNITQPLDDFSKNPHGMVDGHLHQCKRCILKRVQKWRKENPELVKNRRKELYWKYRDDAIKRAIEWGRKNKEKRKISKNKWRAKNRELTCHYAKESSYRKKNAEGSHTLQEYKDKLKKFGGMCVYCNKRKATTQDHIIPLSKGGNNYIENIAPACVSCNSSKHNKLLSEWKGLLE